MDKLGPRYRAVYFDEKRNTQSAESQSRRRLRNGAEPPRLLLLSANKQFLTRLANSSGLVGQNLMSQQRPRGSLRTSAKRITRATTSAVSSTTSGLDSQKVAFMAAAARCAL